MNTSLAVSLISAAVAVASAVFTGLNTRGIESMKARLAAEKDAVEKATAIEVYRAPFSRAAYDLQSRIYNILRQHFLDLYLTNRDARTRVYAIESTTFLIAQLFCWIELTRQEIHYIEMPTAEATQQLLRLQDRLQSLWATDMLPPPLRIFSGEQRAIGEALIVGEPEYTTCMGYGAFLKAFPKGRNQFLDHVRSEIAALRNGSEMAEDRLRQIQHILVEILDLMDPNGLRFGKESRSKI